MASFHAKIAIDHWTGLRRDLHRHPELGFEEQRTSRLVADELARIGCEVHRGLATTGVVGTLRNGDGPMVGLRADMDALPMTETSGVDWTSTADGRFHGCGHDGHTASLLATAEHLAETRAFAGTVVFIFQPAEEGLGGGRVMVEEGLFDHFPCDFIFGFHNMPLLPLGRAAIRPGPMMASFDEIRIDFLGHGGHAAAPHLALDPVLAAADALTALSALPARRIDPNDAAVLTMTQIHGGTTHNVISDSAWIGGTVRSLSEAARATLEDGVKRVAARIAEAHEVEGKISYERKFPVLMNDLDATEILARAARTALGADALADGFKPLLAAEDFAFMLQTRPGAYILLGQRDDDHQAMVHNPAYDFNDRLIPHVVATLAAAVAAA